MEREAQSCNDLIGLCARLPLALNIATARCAIEPIWSVAAQMRDAGKRLAALETGDPATSVRAVFSCSYDRLSDPAARMFRLLGLHFGPDVTIGVAASLAAISVPDASLLMDELANAHLATEHSQGRYVLHDLLRAYAAELAATHDDDADRLASSSRALDHYLHSAAVAMDVVYPAERHRRPRVTPSPASMVPPMADEAAARRWLEPERANLVAAVAHAADHGWPDHATQLAGTLLRHLRVTGHYPDITAMCTAALRAARQTGDPRAEADALQGLTIVAMRHSRYQEAAALLRQALSRYRDAGDPTGEARTLGNLGIVSCQLGHYRQAVGYNHRALARYRQVGDQPGEVRTLNNLSLVDLRLGHVHQAADQLQHALDLAQALRFDEMKVFCLAQLGLVDMRLGQLDQAAARIKQAVALSQELADPVSESFSLTSLAAVLVRQGRHRQATTFLRRALDLARQMGDDSAVAEVLNGRGELLLATGGASRARDTYAEALTLAAKACDRYQEALAHNGLAQAHDAAGEAAESGRHRQAAIALFARLGTPEAQVAAGTSR
jgi:tetratricopeptide (TPR) repeat protein